MLQISGSSMQFYIFDKNGHLVNLESLYVLIHNYEDSSPTQKVQ